MPTRTALAPLCSALAALVVLAGALVLGAPGRPDDHGSPVLVSGRSFVDRAGRPFAWLADDATGLLGALNRSEVARYLDARAEQGFTVVRASLDVPISPYGDAPFADGRPVTTPGADPADDAQYDFWDHLDHVVVEAAARGLAVALDPGPDGYGPARGVVRTDGAEFAVLPAGACADPPRVPDRPVVAGEVNEETPRCTGGRSTAADVRADAWSAVLGGAAGYTYGHPAVRAFQGGWTADGQRRGDWVDALDAPAAEQVRHLSALLRSRPGLLADGPTPTTVAAYAGEADDITIDLGDLTGEVRIWWFDPRTGEAVEVARASGGGSITLPVPDPGRDWAIVADDADAALPEPGERGDAEGGGSGADGVDGEVADGGVVGSRDGDGVAAGSADEGIADGGGTEERAEPGGREGAVADGRIAEEDAADGGVAEGDGADGEVTDGNVADGDVADGEAVVQDPGGGEVTDGGVSGEDAADEGGADGGEEGSGTEERSGDAGAGDRGSGADGTGDGADGTDDGVPGRDEVDGAEAGGDAAGGDGAGGDGAGGDGAGGDGAGGDGTGEDRTEEDAAGEDAEGATEVGGTSADGALDGLTGADGIDPDAGDSGATEDVAQPEPEPEPEPEPAPEPVADAGVWDRLAQCESSGDWEINTGNGYYGGLQFDEATWGDYGGTEFAPRADQATREQQIEVAIRVRDDRGGYGSWPACAEKLGLPR